MKLDVNFISSGCADGIYKITAKGCIAASLHWADKNGILPGWTAFAYVPLSPSGVGAFRYTGSRSVPPDAEYVLAKAVSADFTHTEEIVAEIPDEQRSRPFTNGERFYIISDIHLSNKPWKLRKALSLIPGEGNVLIAGDLTNDGTPEQLRAACEILEGCGKTVFAVSGNHDYPLHPSPYISDGIGSYYELQNELLKRSVKDGFSIELDRSGAYAARKGNIEIIGLNTATHWRRLTFRRGEQLAWLDKRLDDGDDNLIRIVMCHAPLISHNPQRPADGTPYFGRDKVLQSIIDRHKKIIFLSGHTHISPNDYNGCVDVDKGNIYINDGSICPTTYKSKEPLAPNEWTDGVFTELNIEKDHVTAAARSVTDGKYVSRGYYSFTISLSI